MVKTVIENRQNLIVEGCYIPFTWYQDFEKEYLGQIKYYCLIMSERYIKNHFASIKEYANCIENRVDDEACTIENILEDNAQFLALAEKYRVDYVLIDDKYVINIDWKQTVKYFLKRRRFLIFLEIAIILKKSYPFVISKEMTRCYNVQKLKDMSYGR